MSTTASAVLLENASATGDWVNFPGGIATFEVIATAWGGGNVTLEKLGPDGTTPITNLAGTFSANGIARGVNNLYYPPGKYRAAVSGGATGVWARLDRVPT